jgi:Lipocalin-like domain
VRVAGYIAILLLWLSCLRSSPCEAGPHHGPRSEAARQQLIGAWRLAAIEYSGPHGETVDPYYQAGSSGIIIYDSSGWMSVQITAQNRRKWEVPAVRVPRPVGEEDAALKAEAFDTYYSYYGTWDYDAATSVVTHHVKSSIIPAETGLDYAQTVTLEGAHLIFTVRSGSPGTETVRKKVWERLPQVTNTRTTRKDSQ